MCLNITICKYLVLKQSNMNNFHSLDVAGRSSDTKHHVG